MSRPIAFARWLLPAILIGAACLTMLAHAGGKWPDRGVIAKPDEAGFTRWVSPEARNQGFLLNYPLDAAGTNGSASGTNSIALPYNQQTNLVNASDLADDIDSAGGGVLSVSRLERTTDELETYDGLPANDFALTSGEGYRVRVSADVNYDIVGSHDPGLVINLDTHGTNGSATGTNDFAFPYHGTAASASQLADEINAQGGSSDIVISISRFVKQTDTLQTYNGTLAGDFPLRPGESYRIQVRQNVAYIPSHY